MSEVVAPMEKGERRMTMKFPKVAVPKITKSGYYKTLFCPARCAVCNDILDGPGYIFITNTNFLHTGDYLCEKCHQTEKEEIEA